MPGAASWLRRHQPAVLLTLGVAILLALGLGLVRRGYLDTAALAGRKDAIAAVNSLVGIAATLAAFALAYFRFFAGRTLARRAELTLSAEVAMAPGACLHALTLRVDNKGSLTLRDLALSLSVVDRLPGGGQRRSEVAAWLENDAFAAEGLSLLVDPGETVQFHAARDVPIDVWASSYAAAVRDRDGNVWQAFALAAPPLRRA